MTQSSHEAPQRAEDELDEAFKSGFNAGFGEAKLSQDVTEKMLRKKVAGMRALLLAGCDLLAIESEALRNSIRIVGDPDRLSDAPEDAHTVEAIREMEGWIASVKVTLYPTTPEAEGGSDA